MMAAVTPRTAEDLKKQIDALFELQHETLKSAAYLGIAAEQPKEVEARRKEITALVDQLAALKSTK